MQSRSRLVLASVLVTLAVAACSSSTATPAASATAQTATPSTVAASPDGPGASPAASDGSAASAAPSASVGPTASPTAEQQALMGLLPKSIGAVTLVPTVTTLKELTAANQAPTAFADFAKALGLAPENVLLVYVTPSGSVTGNWSLGAYRFVGADPAKLKDGFIKKSVEQGLTVKDAQVGGRTVTGMYAPSTANQPPEYLIFAGDTIFFAGAADPTLAESMVKALPQ
jgi:hypothetical protein